MTRFFNGLVDTFTAGPGSVGWWISAVGVAVLAMSMALTSYSLAYASLVLLVLGFAVHVALDEASSRRRRPR